MNRLSLNNDEDRQLPMNKWHRTFACIFLTASLFSCRSLKQTVNIEPYSDECQKAIGYKSPGFLSLEDIKADTFLTSRYALQSLLFANAYGLIDDLREYEILEESLSRDISNDSLKIELLIKEGMIDKRLDQAALELEALSNYIECHGLHILRVKSDIGELNLSIQNKYTNAAVFAGAAAAIIVGGLLIAGNEGDEKDWVGVAGGAAAAILAINSARVDKKAHINHKENIIASIWKGENSFDIFPASSWYLINQSSLLDRVDGSLREYIINSWKSSQSLLGNENNYGYLPTLLGDKGDYTEKMLQLRLDMLEDITGGIDHLLRTLYLINSEME